MSGNSACKSAARRSTPASPQPAVWFFFNDASADVQVEQECGGESIRKGSFLVDRKSKELFTIFDYRAGWRLAVLRISANVHV